jgi:hypothetical protein
MGMICALVKAIGMSWDFDEYAAVRTIAEINR